MFTISIAGLLVCLGIFLMAFRSKRLSTRKWSSQNDATQSALVFAIIAWIIAFAWFCFMSVGSYTCQLNDFTKIKQASQEIQLYGERRDKLIEVVRLELAKYPEYEKKIIGNIQPQMMILSQFPNLKSNETIVKTVEEIVKLEDSVYKIRASMIGTQQKMFYREISPWVICVIPYQKLFGQQNPLVGLK